jgi:hypothetical protein
MPDAADAPPTLLGTTVMGGDCVLVQCTRNIRFRG